MYTWCKTLRQASMMPNSWIERLAKVSISVLRILRAALFRKTFRTGSYEIRISSTSTNTSTIRPTGAVIIRCLFWTFRTFRTQSPSHWDSIFETTAAYSDAGEATFSMSPTTRIGRRRTTSGGPIELRGNSRCPHGPSTTIRRARWPDSEHISCTRAGTRKPERIR